MKNSLLAGTVLLAATLAATGCERGASGPKIRSFDATPGILPTAGGTVTLTWDASAESLELEPGVGAVSGTAHTLVVTQTTEFELVAKKNGRKKSARTLVTVAGPSTVTGTVRAMLTRAPLAGIAIFVNGVSATVTDAEGNFAFDSVPTPYQLAIFDPTQRFAIVYDGVTRPDPVLELPFINAGELRSADIAGTVTPGENDPNVTTGLWIQNDYQFGGNFAVVATNGDWATSATWGGGPASTTADVLALRYETPPGGGIEYTHFGQANGVVADPASPTTGVSVPLDSIDTETITGVLSDPPAGIAFSSVSGLLLLGEPTGSSADRGIQLFGATLGTANDFSMPVPDVQDARIQLWAALEDDDGFLGYAIAQASPGAGTVEIQSPRGVKLLSPIDGGTVSIDASPLFRVSSEPGSVKFYFFSSDDGPSTELIWVTMDDEIPFPVLEEAGIDFTQTSAIWWNALEVGSHESIDGVVGPGGILGERPEFITFGDERFLFLDGGSGGPPILP